MKLFLIISLFTTALALAGSIEKRGLTNFDQYAGTPLNLVDTSFGPNRGLFYEGLGLAEIYDDGSSLQGVDAKSNPNVLAYGTLDRLDDNCRYITSIYTGSSGTFDLQSIYFGCVIGTNAANCTIILTGYKNGTQVGEVTALYQPVVNTGAPMTQIRFDSSFAGIDAIRFETTFEDQEGQTNLGSATFFDDIRYTYNPQ